MREPRRPPKAAVFAVVRVDDFQGATVPVIDRIAVVKVLRDEKAAAMERERLEMLQRSRGIDASYYVMQTRMEEGAE